MQMTGVAESDEALLELLDNLFRSPAFEDPVLPGERYEAGTLRFAVNVTYLPGRAAASAPAGPAGAPTPELVEEGSPAAGEGP
jgi:hypothetical protein